MKDRESFPANNLADSAAQQNLKVNDRPAVKQVSEDTRVILALQDYVGVVE